MQITSKFTIALHIFAATEYFKDTQKITSDFLASSIGTNPVIIRNILIKLKKAELIKVKRGTGGIIISKNLNDISFYDVYKAIEPLNNDQLFHFHEHPNMQCPVGSNIHNLLDDKLFDIQKAMEDKLKEYTIEEIVEELSKKNNYTE